MCSFYWYGRRRSEPDRMEFGADDSVDSQCSNEPDAAVAAEYREAAATAGRPFVPVYLRVSREENVRTIDSSSRYPPSPCRSDEATPTDHPNPRSSMGRTCPHLLDGVLPPGKVQTQNKTKSISRNPQDLEGRPRKSTRSMTEDAIPLQVKLKRRAILWEFRRDRGDLTLARTPSRPNLGP